MVHKVEEILSKGWVRGKRARMHSKGNLFWCKIQTAAVRLSGVPTTQRPKRKSIARGRRCRERKLLLHTAARTTAVWIGASAILLMVKFTTLNYPT